MSMKTYKKFFNSKKEAEAFVEGVEFVNDSYLEVKSIEKADKTRPDSDPLSRWVIVLKDKE